MLGLACQRCACQVTHTLWLTKKELSEGVLLPCPGALSWRKRRQLTSPQRESALALECGCSYPGSITALGATIEETYLGASG